MKTQKTMKLVNKFIAYLLVAAMLFGFASPMSKVQAANTITELDVTDGYKNGGTYTALMLEFKSVDAVTLPEKGALTAVPGSGELKYNDLSVAGVVNFKVSNVAGVFQIDGLEKSAYQFPEASDVISVKGQFTLPGGSVVEFPATTFQYMGTNASGLGYWRVFVQAASTSTGALDVSDAYKNGNDYSSLMLEFKSKTAIALPITSTTTLVPVTGSGELIYNNQNVTGQARLRAANAAGIFQIDDLQKTPSGFPKELDVITVRGQFKISDESIVEFEETTFQYMGLNANGKGYWKVSTDVTSIDLHASSLNGTYEYGWGVAIFSTTNGKSPAPTGKRALVSHGGTITKISAATGEESDITATAVINGGYTDNSGLYYFEGIGAPSAGDIFIIKGRFQTEDGFSINIQKTAFQYQGSKAWAPYVKVIDSGDATYKGKNNGVFYFSVSNKELIFDEANGKEVKLRAYNNSGTILKNGVVQNNGSSVDFVYGSDKNCALWGAAIGEGVEYTIQGQFTLSNDNSKVINFPKTVFRAVKADDGSYNWVIMPNSLTDNYVDSGSVNVHDNSVSVSTSATDQIWFKTDDVSLPKNTTGDGWLRPYDGTITYNGTDITGKKGDDTGAKIFSHGNGIYLIYTLRGAQNGTTVSIQGSFAMADGSVGIDFQPVTFQYVKAEDADKGYWVTVGTNFTSDIYWEAQNAYEEEILAYEATVRLPKKATATGGVILGTNRDNGDTYAFGVDANGAPYLTLKDGATTVEYKFTDVNVCTGNWVTMRIVRDGASVSYYENGTLKATLENQTVVSVKPVAKATVGGDYTANNTNYFKGTLKEVKVYADVACTQTIASYDMSVVSSKTKLIADGNDNKEYDITRTLRWLNPDEVSVPNNYAYSFAVVGDTQAINDKNGNKNDKLQKVYDYIVNNKESQNIQFVFGLGDIGETNDVTEWNRAKEQIQKLNLANIPYSLVRGNHEGVLQNEGSTLMNQYFPYEDYKNKLNVYYDGKIENSCQKLTVGDVDYLIFALDYNASEDVLKWAGSIIETHPNYNVIITTHGYMTANKEYTTDAEGGGTRVWNNLAKKYSNVVLVLCGHVYANDIAWNQVEGDNGNLVTQMVINPQRADAMTDGGTGMVAMLYFSEDGKNVQVRYYSTVRNQYLADTNQFNFDLNVVKHVDAVTTKAYTNVKTTYRSTQTYTYPTLDGYLFAGWYTDAACTKALAKDAVVDDTTTYYAKFVDENALTVKRQIRENGKDLRLVTSIDSLQYEGVGFNVAFGNSGLKSLGTIRKVYSSLFAAGTTYRPDLISAASNYFTVITIKGIPETMISANVEVTVQPYWITIDGTTVVGTSVTKPLIP